MALASAYQLRFNFAVPVQEVDLLNPLAKYNPSDPAGGKAIIHINSTDGPRAYDRAVEPGAGVGFGSAPMAQRAMRDWPSGSSRKMGVPFNPSTALASSALRPA